MLTDGRHIKLSEVACHDDTPVPVELESNWNETRDMFDKIRDKWNAPLSVVCGYRTEKWNKKLIREDRDRGAHQVASGSQHLSMKALDIRTQRKEDLSLLYRAIISMHENGELPELGGIAMYPFSNWIHVDTYRVDHLRKWRGT
jgi:uncharacterized protein YcbK (DUF882 family)